MFRGKKEKKGISCNLRKAKKGLEEERGQKESSQVAFNELEKEFPGQFLLKSTSAVCRDCPDVAIIITSNQGAKPTTRTKSHHLAKVLIQHTIKGNWSATRKIHQCFLLRQVHRGRIKSIHNVHLLHRNNFFMDISPLLFKPSLQAKTLNVIREYSLETHSLDKTKG